MDNRMYIVIEDGKKIAMPRYFKDKIYTEMQRKRIAYFAKQKSFKLQKKYEAEMLRKYGSNWSQHQVDIDQFKFQKFKNESERNRDKI